jgi:ferritin-like metal-binding protein YciE
MSTESLQSLYQKELNRLNKMEKQSLEVLPGLWRAASSPELASAFRDQYDKSRYHAHQLDRLLNSNEASDSPVEGAEGLFHDCQKASNTAVDVRDVALIAAAQHLEHDEIAGYGCARAWASVLGQRDAASILDSCLKDKKVADARLSRIASRVNRRAATAIAMG